MKINPISFPLFLPPGSCSHRETPWIEQVVSFGHCSWRCRGIALSFRHCYSLSHRHLSERNAKRKKEQRPQRQIQIPGRTKTVCIVKHCISTPNSKVNLLLEKSTFRSQETCLIPLLHYCKDEYKMLCFYLQDMYLLLLLINNSLVTCSPHPIWIKTQNSWPWRAWILPNLVRDDNKDNFNSNNQLHWQPLLPIHI